MKLRNAKPKKKPANLRPSRFDPTRTGGLRRAFVSVLRNRFDLLRRTLLEFVAKGDAFGLERDPSPFVVNAEEFAFHTEQDKVRAFQNWLEAQFSRTLVNYTTEQLWEHYVQEGFKRGAGRAFEDVMIQRRAQRRVQQGTPETLGFTRETREEFLRSSFGKPVAIDKVKLLAGRGFDELKDVTREMSNKMSRVLVDGLVTGKGARQVAREMSKQVGLSLERATTIARTEIIRAHAEGQLMAMDKLGVTHLGVAVEWSTSKDERVCPLCKPLEGIVVTLQEAHGLLPRHPNCRCAWKPAVLTKKTQTRDQIGVARAIATSIYRGVPKYKKTANPDWADSYQGWGATAKIGKDRPRGITINRSLTPADYGLRMPVYQLDLLDQFTLNEGGNCGTGAGGFQPGNSCAKGEGSGVKAEKMSDRLRAEVLARSAEIGFEETVVGGDSISRREYDRIEGVMTDEEREEMGHHIDSEKASFVESMMDSYEPNYADRDRLREWAIDELGEDATEQEITQSMEEIERSHIDESHEAARRRYEEMADNDEGSIRRDYLTSFHWEHQDEPRFTGEVGRRDGVWQKLHGGDDVYSFKTSREDAYSIIAEDVSTKMKAPEGYPSYTLKARDVVFSDEGGSYAVTGKAGVQGAREVFAQVTPAVVSLAQRKDLDVMTFSAAEESRQKLYDRLVKTVTTAMPEYSAVALKGKYSKQYAIVKKGLRDHAMRHFENEAKQYGFADETNRAELLVNTVMDDFVINVFCPTGKGGGVDPTCSPPGAGSGGKTPETWGKRAAEIDGMTKRQLARHLAGSIGQPERTGEFMTLLTREKMVALSHLREKNEYFKDVTVTADEWTNTYFQSDKDYEAAGKAVYHNPDVDAQPGTSRVGVPAMTVPPPPPIGRIPHLTPHERAVESAFIEHYEKDPEGVAAAFRQVVSKTTLPGQPKTFGTDDAKELASAWSHPDQDKRLENRARLNIPLHQTANAIAKKAFVQELDTLKPGGEILVTVGGCGAGKGYALKNVPEALALKKGAAVVWDSAGDQNATENPWIQHEAEKRGLKVAYVYVHAPPERQWAHPEMGVIKRASDVKDGRMVDARVFADSYAYGARNHAEFAAKHADNPSARFLYLDSSGAKPKLVDSMPKEATKVDAKELYRFAMSTVEKVEAPKRVKSAATSGARIWSEE